jgi:hypothetical protein
MALKLSKGMTKALLDRIGGKGFSEIFHLGAIYLYASPRPASANDAETGVLLAVITDGSLAWTPADGTNGLTFDTAVDGTVDKAAAQVWSGVGLVAGTAVWGRLVALQAGGVVTGASDVFERMDFSVGTFSGDLIMGSAAIAVGKTVTLDEFELVLPNGE